MFRRGERRCWRGKKDGHSCERGREGRERRVRCGGARWWRRVVSGISNGCDLGGVGRRLSCGDAGGAEPRGGCGGGETIGARLCGEEIIGVDGLRRGRCGGVVRRRLFGARDSSRGGQRDERGALRGAQGTGRGKHGRECERESRGRTQAWRGHFDPRGRADHRRRSQHSGRESLAALRLGGARISRVNPPWQAEV